MMVEWYAVRCCCEPLKIFGFLPLPRGPAKHSVVDRFGVPHRIELRPIRLVMRESFDLYFRDRMVEPVISEEEVAIYSDDRPIEFWRTIPDFVEAVGADA